MNYNKKTQKHILIVINKTQKQVIIIIKHINIVINKTQETINDNNNKT